MFLFDSKKIAKVIFKELLNSKEEDINTIISNLLAFIKKNKIQKNIKQIIKYIELEFKRYKASSSLFVEAPFHFRQGDLDNIIKRIKLDIKEDVETNFKENKKLLGGFVIKFKNKIYNGSVINQLEELKRSIKS